MSNNVTRVQLPDGGLLKIEGGDAQTVADIISNRCLGQGHPAQKTQVEEPVVLNLPELNFSKPAQPSQLVQNPAPARGFSEDEVLPLPLPVLA